MKKKKGCRKEKDLDEIFMERFYNNYINLVCISKMK